ncbi:membrane docking protein [Dehalobacter sp. UNSWDHB]|uniref:Putative reductive dehalogenase membrane anchor protein n=2 Tax=Dehalobacter TaxID=56112 RepID=J7HYJ0_9FIRM|nr:putative reductive dehalogenase membrane anchor protein [Dehalobacter sp. enrichment culture clone rdhB05]AFV03405.1 putative reductive dehalogenase membrane anchor protein [Dehalobacter sp. DCA]AFV06392.1 putative reductive dehalogenase membrane anchor protein [Dehalobacter sp. CF]EQB21092.1 membrane docking protein [Dehalobacter sp. UNSWDHB]
MMATFLIFLAGVLFLAGILFIKPRAKREQMWKTVLNWGLYVIWYAITWMGISFIYINASVGHVKATSTAIFLFLGISVVLAIVLARLLGFITVGKTKKISTEQA